MSTPSAAPQLIEDLRLVFTDSSSSLPPWFGPAAISLLLAAGVVGLRGWRKLRTAQRARRAAIAGFLDGPPDVWALRRLTELRASTGTLAAHSFALEVSEILRVFLERRFDLHAVHQTTEEFLHDAHEGGMLSSEQQERLREFLGRCDEAKFARRCLAQDRKRELIESAVRTVKEMAAARLPDAPRLARTGGHSRDRQEHPARAATA